MTDKPKMVRVNRENHHSLRMMRDEAGIRLTLETLANAAIFIGLPIVKQRMSEVNLLKPQTKTETCQRNSSKSRAPKGPPSRK